VTLNEIKQVLDTQAAHAKKHKIGIIFRPASDGFIELDPTLVLEAFAQVQKAVVMLQAGISVPSQHKAEALLLQLFSAHAEHGGGPNG